MPFIVNRDVALVCRTSVDADGGRVGPEFGIFRIAEIGEISVVSVSCCVIQDPSNPAASIWGEIVPDEFVLVVVGIHNPAHRELFLIVDTSNVMRFCLCLSKGGKEHACKNRYDGNNDKEFDESEPEAVI